MVELIPKSEAVKKAIKWISDQRQENPDKPLGKLIEEATFRFDISPGDAEFLIRFYKNQRQIQ